MANTPMDERRFTDEEVREILKKAVEKAPSRALARKEGLSLAELKAIGEEVGIDPLRLEDAARAVVSGRGNGPKRLLGGATVLHFERKVQGELQPQDTPEVLSRIRRTMGTQGEVDEIHGSLEWRARGDSGERLVTVSTRDGTTTVQSSANLTNAAVLTYLPPGILGSVSSLAAVAGFLNDGNALGALGALVVLPVLYVILRFIYGKIAASQAGKLEAVVEEVARMLEKPQA